MYNLNNDNNTLAQFLRQYITPQPQQNVETSQHNINSQSNNYSGVKVYEIMKKDDLTYIKPDDNGQKQIVLCEPEKEIYVARHNYATGKPDYEKYISEGTVELFKKNDTSAEMSLIAEALSAVVNKLENLDKAINEIKESEPKIIEKIVEKPVEVIKEVIKEIPIQSTAKLERKSNGQFKKKGAN